MDISRRLIAEGVGTAFLLAAIVGSGIMAVKLSGGNEGLALLCNSTATGAIPVVLISVFGQVSGAHLQPSHAPAFIVAQLVGALTGAVFYRFIFVQPPQIEAGT